MIFLAELAFKSDRLLDFRKQSTENFQGFFEEEMRGNPYGLEK